MHFHCRPVSRSFIQPVIGVSLLPFLTGCGLLPPLGNKRLKGDVEGMHAKAPSRWTALPEVSASVATGWLADFQDARLKELVDRAMAANPDLKAAGARVMQARAVTAQASAALYPAISGGFSSSRAQSPGDQRFSGINQIANRFRMPLNVSWDVDLWGRLADERAAAKAGWLAEESVYQAARLSLAANTVRSAITLAEAQAQFELAERDVQARRVQMGILEKQLERGIDPDRAALDVSLSRADLARAESAVQQNRASVDQARRALEVLLGGYPEGKEPGLARLPSLRRSVPAGLPSELLLRRPDLRAAERRLEEALRQESAAKKAFLPSIRLTADNGRTSQELSQLLTPEAAFWSVASNITQTFFQGGRLRAGVSQAKARYEEQLQNYAGTLLTAFQEVETALAADRYLLSQAAALTRAAEEAERSEQLALGQYEKGLAEVLTLLDARQRAFDARSALIAAQALRLRNRTNLYLALGGEF